MYPIIDKKKTGINLRRHMDKNNISVKDLQRYLELGSVQSIYHWLNGISLPTIDNLYALSELFQLPMDGLICGNRSIETKKEEISNMDRHTRRLYLYYTAFDEKCMV